VSTLGELRTGQDIGALAAQRLLIGGFGARLGGDVRDRTAAIYEPRHPRELAHRVLRDLPYGPHRLQRLDLHLPEEGVEQGSVLCYVHGGGYVGGDKGAPGRPFYDNIGRWGAGEGFVVANLNYRLAPDDAYPAGGEDVALALHFVQQHVAEHGADPARVVMMGHSAGSSHVATMVANPELWPAGTAAPAGAVLSSGTYDPLLGGDERLALYFGDREAMAARSAIPGLCATDVPLLVSTTEFDPPDLQVQALSLFTAFFEAHGRLPQHVFADGHNHFSVVQQIGTADTWFSERLARFIVSPASPGTA